MTGNMTGNMTGPWDAPEVTSWRRLPMHTVRPATPTSARPRRALAVPAAAGAGRAPRGPLDRGRGPRLLDHAGVRGPARRDDRPHYTNVQMPWPDLPPHPPAANPTGVYERDVEVPAEWAGRRVVLHVGAAESVLLAEVNGVQVGIGKDSHLAAEFDVTDAVRPGGGQHATADGGEVVGRLASSRTRTSGGTAGSPARCSSTRPSRCTSPTSGSARPASGDLGSTCTCATAGGALPAGWYVTGELDGRRRRSAAGRGVRPRGAEDDASPTCLGEARMPAAVPGRTALVGRDAGAVPADRTLHDAGRRSRGQVTPPHRLPRRRDRRPRPAGQRRAGLHPRRQPARLPPADPAGC